MKKIIVVFMMILMMGGVAVAEAFDDNQALVFETVKWCNDVPKNAQVLAAREYTGDFEGIEIHTLLIHTTQDENINMMFGMSSEIIIVDLETGDVYTYKNLSMPETGEISSREDALSMVYNCYDSFLQGYNDGYWVGRQNFIDMPAEDIEAINAELSAHFVKE